MTYKCLECGHIFEGGEQARWSESRGEYWGTPCSEEMSGCPVCNGAYAKATPCAICGSQHLENDLNGGVCDECINECKYEDELCYKIGEKEKETIDLNSFLVSMIGEHRIESILYHYLMAEKTKTGYLDCSPYIDGDRLWFGNQIREEVAKK